MADLSTLQTAVLAAAAIVGALAVIWRGLFRPLGRGFAAVREIAHNWDATVELVRELVPLVAQLVVSTDRRISRLEAVVGMRSPQADDEIDQASSLLAQQLAARTGLRDPNSRTRTSDRRPSP